MRCRPIVFGKLLLASVGTFTCASAQQSHRVTREEPRVQLAVDYSYLRANATPGQCGCFSLNGGSAEVALRAYRNFSVVGDITGSHAGTTSVAGQSLSLLSYTVGPRFSYPLRGSKRTPIVPFIQGLVGAVHGFDAPFPTSSGTLAMSANALAVLVGGGVDVALSRRFGIRAAQVDYGLNHLPNNSKNNENLLRVSAGVVFRIH